jgi:transposase-like protein
MVFPPNYLRDFLKSGKSLGQMTKEVITQFYKELYYIEAKDWVDENNQILDDGRNRLVFDGCSRREILSINGMLDLQIPKIRDRGDPLSKIGFTSSMLPKYVRRLDDFNQLLPWLYLNGFSTGQFEEVFRHLFGNGFKGLAPTTISRVISGWDGDFKEWSRTSLADGRYPYVWGDGVFFSMRGSKRDSHAILVLIGVNEEGRKEPLGISSGFREDGESWRDMLLDLRKRGLESPLVAVGDGGLGLWKGLNGVFPDCAQQHCWYHKMDDVKKLLPKSCHGAALRSLKEVMMQPARADGMKELSSFSRKYEARYPKAVDTVARNVDSLQVFYDFPARHWMHLRTNNPCENMFSAVRLRTNKMRGMGSMATTFTMVFKLIQTACEHSRAINGVADLKALLDGVRFKDGDPDTRKR